jgi:hypothetical protein
MDTWFYFLGALQSIMTAMLVHGVNLRCVSQHLMQSSN